MEKEILINTQIRKAIMSHFGCSYPTVRVSLKYKSHTLLAQQIRDMALELGGAKRKD